MRMNRGKLKNRESEEQYLTKLCFVTVSRVESAGPELRWTAMDAWQRPAPTGLWHLLQGGDLLQMVTTLGITARVQLALGSS